MKTLEKGTYRLTRDVKNPHPDRRVKRDWRCVPVWEKGEKFHVEQWNPDQVNVVRRIDGYNYQEMSVHNGDLCELIESLERVEETPSEYLKRRRNDRGALEMLDWLVANGKLSMLDLQLAEKTVYDGYGECKEYYKTEEPLASFERTGVPPMDLVARLCLERAKEAYRQSPGLIQCIKAVRECAKQNGLDYLTGLGTLKVSKNFVEAHWHDIIKG